MSGISVDWLAPRLGPALIGSVCLAFVLVSTQAPALAGAEVQGDTSAMRLSVENASTRDALQALSTSIGLKYSLPATVERTINGVYLGSLREVLARVLDGNNYVLKFSEEHVEVVVFAPTGPATSAPPPPAIAINHGFKPAASSTSPNKPPPLASYLAGNAPGRAP